MSFELQFKFSRFMFGLIILLVGLKGFSDISSSATLIRTNVTEFNSEEGLSALFDFEFLGERGNRMLKNSLDFTVIADVAEEFVMMINTNLILGGLMTMFGISIGRFFIISSLLVDLFFIHNLRFFATDSSKGLMIKYIAYIGGALHI